MQNKNENDIVDELSRLLLDIMTLTDTPKLPAHYASIDSFKTLHSNLLALREFLYAASNGGLSKPIPFKGFIAGTLKTLQANLRHLTWQTKMIASGDFTQRVEFMGEFAEAFNSMVTQLEQTLQELVKKEAELSRINEDLLKEISVRKQIEADLLESQKKLKVFATTDQLTGLYNRRFFYELTEVEIRKSIRFSRPLSIIFFDIDFFKHINDTFGHSAGDMVLKMMAKLAKEIIRTSDILARYGGEEFVVLLPETPALQAAIVAEKLRKQIENTTIQIDNHQIAVTVSFGVSDSYKKIAQTTPEMILSELIAGADKALYISKTTGRNKVTIW